eukprot:TRINITY_DN66113_c0_g1_i1.p1 TRINITY_DN66113_c0_g1~~TRINITY_DN66113_c0_g1_i1.p1  ORF type:complete len:170 (+),score=21.68 TRINITY_DN66113_c0_g1_i1:59-511(+)
MVFEQMYSGCTKLELITLRLRHLPDIDQTMLREVVAHMVWLAESESAQAIPELWYVRSTCTYYCHFPTWTSLELFVDLFQASVKGACQITRRPLSLQPVLNTSLLAQDISSMSMGQCIDFFDRVREASRATSALLPSWVHDETLSADVGP